MDVSWIDSHGLTEATEVPGLRLKPSTMLQPGLADFAQSSRALTGPG